MHAATFTAVVVLPTPPFWLAIAYTVPIARKLAPIATRLRGGPAVFVRASGACAPCPAGKPRRGLGDLLEDVQMVVVRALERLDAADLQQSQAQLARPRRPPAPPAPSRGARASPRARLRAQQRRRVLEHDRLRAQARVRPPRRCAQTLAPLLGPRADHARVLDSAAAAHPLENCALRAGSPPASPRSRAAPPPARARESRRRSRCRRSRRAVATALELQRHQRVGEMDVHGLACVAHSRRRALVVRQTLQHRVQLIAADDRQPITLAERGSDGGLTVTPPRRPGVFHRNTCFT